GCVRLELARGDGDAPGHAADNRVRLAVERDAPADDGAIAAEAALPQAVAQDRDMLVADLVFLLGEGAAGQRRHAQDREEVGRDARPVQALRLALAGEVEIADGA